MPERLLNLDILPLTLFYIFCGLFLIQALYYLVIFLRLARFRPVHGKGSGKGVSVVICAHNEYHNLKANLPSILQQDYPEFEVLVVDHASEDETNYLLKDLQREFPNLKSIEIKKDLNFFTGKKFPLAIGIRSAKYEHILLTDADCRPASPGWIRTMQEAYEKDVNVVLGYSPYSRTRSLLNKLIRFDTAHIAVQYMSYALAGIPYMGVGRNLSYLKSLFYDNKGFISHYRIKSGDDDLFINRVARGSATAVSVDPASFTFSEPKKSFGHWITQKRRHLSTSTHYRFSHKLLLGLYSASMLLFYSLFILMLSMNYSVIPVLGIFIVRMGVQYLILGSGFRKLNEKDLVLFIPLLEIVLLLLNAVIGVTNIFSKPSKWK